MTSFNLDIEKLIKEAFKDNFDTNDFITELSTDICENNPDWWANKVVEPLRDTLNKAILENKELLREIVWEYMDSEFYQSLEDKLREILYEQAEKKVNAIMPKVTIKVENKND